MRPLKLTMSAFAAYKNEITLVFTALGRQGLYLVTGDTGAGKTTIFDAVTYALYGEASGANRKADMFRSKYADSSVPTFVELEFECRGQLYKVKRSPEYERKKERGEGTTKAAAAAELIFPDGRIVVKTKEVTKEIEGIIGLNADQFTQIAMIAQGEFLKLLLASTDERIGIFRKLFNTEKYNRLQEKIKSDYNETDRKCRELRSVIGQYVNSIECAEESEFAAELENAANGAMPDKDIINLAEKIIASDREQLGKLDASEKKLDEEIKMVAALIVKAEENEKKRVQLKNTEEQLEKLVNVIAEAENSFKLAEEKRPEAEQMKKRVSEIEAKLPVYDELEEKLAVKEKLAGEYERISAEAKLYKEKYESLKIQLEDEKREHSQLAENKGLAEKAKADIDRVSDVISQLEKLKKDCSELEKLRKEQTNAAAEYAECAAEQDRAQEKYQRMNRAFMNEQAGVLAQTLEAGKPCMVCGSCEHPSPAVISEGAPSQRELEEAEEKLSVQTEKCSDKYSFAVEMKGKLEEKSRQVSEKCLNLTGEDYSEKTESIISEKLAEKIRYRNSADIKLKLLNDGIRRYDELTASMPATEKSAEDNRKLAEKSVVELAKTETEENNTEKSISELSRQLEFTDRKAAEDKISQLEKSALQIEDDITAAAEKKNRLCNEKSSLEGAAESLKKQLSEAEKTDYNSLKLKQAELDQAKNTLSEQLDSLKIRIAGNDTALARIRETNMGLANEEARLIWLSALNNTANGRYGENGKIMLETYVQTAYFDRILKKANIRFDIMTSGQYTMIRRAEAENNRSQSGLDIDVIDHYNGSVRSVKTLSGGEAFKASLSLALGLSDVIQEAAGGVRLETMFVDEGFGSLDEESLQQALNALSELSEGNRLVGIISHVSELKEKIDRQIRVSKDKSGCSKAIIV